MPNARDRNAAGPGVAIRPLSAHRIGTPHVSAAQLSAFCALLPALPTDLAADVIDELLAAVPCLPGNGDPARREPALVRKLAALRPRDLEEAMLAVQIVSAYCGATLCTQAAAGLDPASREASRLRRDAAVQQRVMASLQRALNRSRLRPMLADPATGEVRPTVPPAAAPSTRRPPADAKADASGEAEQVKPFPPPDLFDNDPELKALNERWYSLPRWEDMTMEERRQTWGYKGEPAKAAEADPPAAG